jgi:hypothetical protein
MNQTRRQLFETAIAMLGVGGVAAYAKETTADEICSTAKGAANPCPSVVCHKYGDAVRALDD